MNRDELLLALKDISAPPEPPWWLPGDAQLVLAAIMITVLILYQLLRKRRQSRRSVTLAGQELARIRAAYASDRDARRLAQALAGWLKRIAMLAHPGQALAALSGDEWLRFLDDSIGDQSFTRGCGRVFGDAVYQAEPRFEPLLLLDLCERWLVCMRPRLVARRRD